MSALSYKPVEHRFGPGETIRAVIRKLNHQGMTADMLDMLVSEFNELNGENIPKPGDVFQIPVFIGFLGSGDKDKMGR